MHHTSFEWLLDCTPRRVQIEALNRSYYGVQHHTNEGEEIDPIWLRDGPAKGWGHLLEMRLGKTPTLLNELMLLNRYHGLQRGVIVAPNSYKPEWVREAKNFGVDLNFHMVESTSFSKSWATLAKQKSWFLVLNYEALRSDNVFPFVQEYVNGPEALIAADESIKIKNPESITSKRLDALRKDIQWSRILTGLPMTQGPQDLYAQLRFIHNTDGQNFYGFRNRYCKMGGFKRKKVVGVKNEDELTKRLNSCSFIAKRKNWGKVTVPDYAIDEIELSPTQAKHYLELEKDMVTLLDSGEEVTAEQVITKLMKQQQISSGFVFDDVGKAAPLMEPDKIPKMARLMEIVNETQGKMIILYHYNPSGDMLAEALKALNPAFIRSKAWMKQTDMDIGVEKDRFNNSDDCRIMLASIEAVKYGHTLPGKEGNRCTTMVFYENTYSLDSRSQVEMRNTASEQDWVNLYVDFVASPVERNVAKALIYKESLVEAVLGTYRQDKRPDISECEQIRKEI